MIQEDCQPCPPACAANPFDRVVVSYLIRGMTRVLWELVPTFTDPGPLTFQLQVGQTNNPNADDWENVGIPVVNQYFAYDPEQRVFGIDNTTHYRVILTTPNGEYVSDPVDGMGVLDHRMWRCAREEIRRRKVDLRYGPSGQEGYLLKRRITGTKCPVCTDYQTGESRDPQCPSCYGTGFLCGYYFPMSCVWASLSPATKRIELDAGQMRGTIEDISVSATMLAIDLLSENDIWVAKKTDDRYFVHRVSNTAEYKGVAIVAQVEMRPVPFSSIIYSIEIPAQLALPPAEEE